MHGGAAVQHPRRVEPLPLVGWQRHQHVGAPRGEARARSRDRLPDDLHGDRLRLLARRWLRGRQRRDGHGTHEGQCGEREALRGRGPGRAD